MDKVLTAIVDFVDGIRFEDLPRSAVDRVVRHTLDSVGCGAGGFSSAPARVAREVAGTVQGPMVASAYGVPAPASVDHVGFVNATANRYLDFNDFGVSGHPSDMIPAVLAMTEAVQGSGAQAVTGIYIAYEVATRLAEAVPPDGGWDQGIYCAHGIAAAQAKVLGLERAALAHALSIAVVPNIPLRVTRFGELSEWKASATAQTAMATTFAVRLAAAGMTGPPEPFEGKDGLLERVWPEFDLDLTPAQPSAIERASLKRHPACFWGQVPIDLALTLRAQMDVADLAAIEVATSENAWRTIGGGRGDAAEKWRPATRETADHSMPYLMAVALADGEVNDSGFTPERLRDPEILGLVDRIRVIERTDLTDRSRRDSCPTEMTARRGDGSEIVVTADVPRGHPDNPMTDDEVGAKFAALADRALAPAQAQELGELLWTLADLDDLDPVTRLFRAFGAHEG